VQTYYLLVSAFLSEEAFALLSFLAVVFFAPFLLAFAVAAGLSVEPLELEPVCATARLAPNITVTTNISSFFMPSPSEIRVAA
jgi:hypothetical protein